jgi:hypothetical protein
LLQPIGISQPRPIVVRGSEDLVEKRRGVGHQDDGL